MPDETFSATPSFIIGVGGTGLKVATFVKKNLMEANRDQLPRRVAFLILDTERDVKFAAGGWGRARDERHATGPVRIEGGEYLPLIGTVRDLGLTIKNEQILAEADPAVRRGQKWRHVSPWFQAKYYIDDIGVDPSVWNLDVGAGQYRQFGRIGLFTHMSQVQTMIEQNLRSIQKQGASNVYVHVVGSFAGGTGAALFMDVAHLVKRLATNAGFRQTPVVFGHFVLTEAFRGTEQVRLGDAGQKEAFDARCYAALRELTRLQGTVVARTEGYPIVYDPEKPVGSPLNSKLTQNLYSAVYLYDGRRDRNSLEGLTLENGLVPSIADLIVAYVDDRSGGSFCSHSVNYQAFYPTYNIPAGQVAYGSVGTYTIELPLYHIIEGWAHDLAKTALDRLLEPAMRDKDTEVPVTLTANKPGGETRDPLAEVERWLETELTGLVGQLVAWGKLSESGNLTLQQQAVDEALQFDARGWQMRLAPQDPAWQQWVANAHETLDGSLREPKNGPYFVDHNVPGNSDIERATNLQQEVEARIRQMVGDSQDVWMRSGGNFRRALVTLANHHVDAFSGQLVKWLNLTLNSDPAVSGPVQGKQGKLGYALAFLQRLETLLKASFIVLKQADTQAKGKRKLIFDTLEMDRQEAAARMTRSGGLFGGNRRAYRDRCDVIAQFHKADIARKVVFDMVEQLQIRTEEAISELQFWQKILGTAKRHEGGAYALVMEGRKEIAADRLRSKNAARWVISDDEANDTYIKDKHDQYERGQLDKILGSIQWKVELQDGGGKLHVNFTMGGTHWDRLVATSLQYAQQNVELLLGRCREAFEAAWSDMSVTAYLRQNWGLRVQDLAKRIYDSSGYLLNVTDWPFEPPMRTTFMRVYKTGVSEQDINFLAALRSAVAQEFKESVEAEEKRKSLGEDQQYYVTDSGQDSHDPFKLTFVMFSDLLTPERINGFAEAQGAYHLFSQNGDDWKRLHVLPAETNALNIERTLGKEPQHMQQRRRELHEDVVAILEDIDGFRLAMRCLAYGEVDYSWNVGGERGMLLYLHTPKENNPSGLRYWRLTILPQGEERNGRIYRLDGSGLATPEHYQLSNIEHEPDLVDAFINFVCVGRDARTKVQIDRLRVEETVRFAMHEHLSRWQNKRDIGWQLTERTKRDAHLEQEALEKAAHIIRLKAFVRHDVLVLLEKGIARWAWTPNGVAPENMSLYQRRQIQRIVDLFTALRVTSEEEQAGLLARLRQLGTIAGERIPDEKVPLGLMPQGAANASIWDMYTLEEPQPGDEWDVTTKETATYRMLLSGVSNQITVGQRMRLQVELLPATVGEESFELPIDIKELHCFVSADGLRIHEAEVVSMSLNPQTGQSAQADFELQAYLCGERAYSVELFAQDPDSDRATIYRAGGHIVVVAPEVGEERPPILSTLDIRVAPPADFVLRVEQVEKNSSNRSDSQHLVYYLSSRMPGLRLGNQAVGNVVLPADDLARVRALLNETLYSSNHVLPEDAHERMISLGIHLFDLLFPVGTCADFREALWQASERLTTWLVVEDGNIWLPWELVVPYREYDEAPLSFLGERYQLGRWVEGLGPPLYTEVPLGDTALAHYKVLEQGQENQDEELLAWRRLLQAPGAYGILQVLKPETPFYSVHLLRHAEQITAQRDIVARNDAPLIASPEKEAAQARLDLRFKRPVVTLGILGSKHSNVEADTDDWLLPERVLPFLRAGASAVIGPWWPTSEASDRIFWTRFYELLERRVPLGETVWRARREVQRAIPHRPDWLAYTLFGDPRARAYWPEPSEGYTVLECLNPDEPLRPGKTYTFRVSIRSRPPVWYQDRLIRAEKLPDRVRALFLAPGLQKNIPEPFEMKPWGRTMRQATIDLTPPAPGDYPLLVQLLEGDEHLKTLQLTLKVRAVYGGRRTNG